MMIKWTVFSQFNSPFSQILTHNLKNPTVQTCNFWVPIQTLPSDNKQAGGIQNTAT